MHSGGRLRNPLPTQGSQPGSSIKWVLFLSRGHRLPAIQKVSLFSQEHAQKPVAMVNGESITLRDLATELASVHSDMGSAENRETIDFNKILDRLITIKLVTQEALNIGFDRTPRFSETGQ